LSSIVTLVVTLELWLVVLMFSILFARILYIHTDAMKAVGEGLQNLGLCLALMAFG
jgi:hypothetical protein